MKVIIGSCGVNWKAAVTVAEFIIVLFEGIDVTRTLNVIVAMESADKEPIFIPVSGRTFGTRVPLIVTLFSINVVPAGMLSITEVFTVGIGESLNISNVNVRISPKTTIDLSAVFQCEPLDQ